MTDEGAVHRPRASRLWWIPVVVAVAILATLLIQGANRPADPYFLDEASGSSLTDFESVNVTITGPDAAADAAAQWCVFLADTDDKHEQGLMNTTDLQGRDGMLFQFDDDVFSSFYMKDTPMPLSIAWFDAGGAFVSATDMEPCLGRAACPMYVASRPYRYALEVPQGRLPALGAVSGSRLTVGGPCE